MKQVLIFITLALLLSSARRTDESPYRYLPNTSFQQGERLSFRVHMGFLNAGTATMRISEEIFTLQDRPCFKIDIDGRTTGLADVLYKVRDNWGSYMDTTALVPIQSYRYIHEGRYRKYEIMDFNHAVDSVVVTTLDKKTKEPKPAKLFPIPNNVQDIVTGYYFTRLVDFSDMQKGDIIKVDGFFDEELYQFKVRFMGRDVVDTKLGDINAILLVPVMEENKLFDGESSIKIWLSDDENKLPLKVWAKMFIGAVEVDIKKAEGVRHPINFAD